MRAFRLVYRAGEIGSPREAGVARGTEGDAGVTGPEISPAQAQRLSDHARGVGARSGRELEHAVVVVIRDVQVALAVHAERVRIGHRAGRARGRGRRAGGPSGSPVVL